MNEQTAVMLVDQLQIAHRLSVGFYQHILPLLTRIATECGCTFWYWNPCHTNRPSMSATPPERKWAWDFVPLYASRHVYRRTGGDIAQIGDVALLFNVYLDYNFKPENRKVLGVKGQPDPVTLEKGPAIVEIMVYRCVAENGKSFEKLWDAAPWPKVEESWVATNNELQAFWIKKPLSEFLANPEGIITFLKSLMPEQTA